MKKIKNWLIWIVVIALLAGAVAVFSIGNEDDEPIKDNNTDDVVDTEDGSELPDDPEPQLVTFNICDCQFCAECIPGEFRVFEGFDVWEGNDIFAMDLFTGDEVTFYVNSMDISVGTSGFYNTEYSFSGPETKNVTLESTYYIWLTTSCEYKPASASAVSYNMRRTTEATPLNADAGEQLGDEGWTPFY